MQGAGEGENGGEEWWLGIYTQKVNVLKLTSVRTKLTSFLFIFFN